MLYASKCVKKRRNVNSIPKGTALSFTIFNRSVMLDRAENLLHDHYGGKDYWNVSIFRIASLDFLLGSAKKFSNQCVLQFCLGFLVLKVTCVLCFSNVC